MEELILKSFLETLVMVSISMVLGTGLGMVVAFLLILTKPSGLWPKPWVYQSLEIVLNAFRSIPFIILIIFLFMSLFRRWNS